jgi:hypothetical protein
LGYSDGTNITGTALKWDVSNNIDTLGIIKGHGLEAIRTDDSWLRLNEAGSFGSGVYTPGLLRTDGGFVSGATGSLGAGTVVATAGIYDSGNRVCSTSVCSISGIYMNIVNSEASSGTLRLGAVNGLPGVYTSGTMALRADSGFKLAAHAVDVSASPDFEIFTNGNAAFNHVLVANSDLVVGGTFSAASGSFSGNLSVTGCIYYDSCLAKVDIAENFPVAEDVQAGDILAVDPNATSVDGFALGKAPSANSIIGVVSTAPAIVLEGNKTTFSGPANPLVENYAAGSRVPIALAGRIPVKVTDENGTIHKGDFLTVSASMPGYAMRAISSGNIVGRALVDLDYNLQLRTRS